MSLLSPAISQRYRRVQIVFIIGKCAPSRVYLDLPTDKATGPRVYESIFPSRARETSCAQPSIRLRRSPAYLCIRLLHIVSLTSLIMAITCANSRTMKEHEERERERDVGLIERKAGLSRDQYGINYSVSLINVSVQISLRRYVSVN